MHNIPALCLSCIQLQIEAVDYGDCANLELYYFINSDCWNTFSKSSSHHIQNSLNLKFLGLVRWKVNLLKKIMHCVLKINIDVNIILDLTKILLAPFCTQGTFALSPGNSELSAYILPQPTLFPLSFPLLL